MTGADPAAPDRGDGRARVDGSAAVLFDMDGLLVDSEPLWTRAEREVAEELGGVFTPAIKAEMIGKRLEVAVPVLLRGLATPAARAADPETVGRQLLRRVVELYRRELTLMPGAAELLSELRSAGVRTALVTSSLQPLADAALPALAPHGFEAVVCGDDVRHGKPHPEPYLAAAARLGLPPSHCVVLEDASAGVASALAAGCRVVFVPSLPEHQSPPPRVLVRDSLQEVDADLLFRLLTTENEPVSGSSAAATPGHFLSPEASGC